MPNSNTAGNGDRTNGADAPSVAFVPPPPHLPLQQISPPPRQAEPPDLPERCALFLDLDGTLAPIVRRPELARVARDTLQALRELQVRLDGAIAIVSGRPIAQIDVLLGPLRLPAAGVHGNQRRDAAGNMYRSNAEPPVPLRRLMADLVARFPNVWIEQKPGALALHYRAAPDAGPACGVALREAIVEHPRWALLGGKCVWEIKPRESTKASAVEAFLLEPPFVNRIPVFCGDDETDEDGFLAARVHGGFGLKINGEPNEATSAEYRVATNAAFTRWLLAQQTRQPKR
jgi:trehalose 6-phosphate phosphatase